MMAMLIMTTMSIKAPLVVYFLTQSRTLPRSGFRYTPGHFLSLSPTDGARHRDGHRGGHRESPSAARGDCSLKVEGTGCGELLVRHHAGLEIPGNLLAKPQPGGECRHNKIFPAEKQPGSDNGGAPVAMLPLLWT